MIVCSLQCKSSPMQAIRIQDKDFILYLSQTEIESAVKKIAGTLNRDYKNETPLFIAILNGSFMFAAELFKSINIPCEICFIKVASYEGIASTGYLNTFIGLEKNITGRHVIILEDIIDTGKTLNQLLPQLYDQQPASLKIAALLHKPEASMHEIKLDYNCFKISNRFVIGFGLDYNGFGRNLPALYQLKEE